MGGPFGESFGGPLSPFGGPFGPFGTDSFFEGPFDFESGYDFSSNSLDFLSSRKNKCRLR